MADWQNKDRIKFNKVKRFAIQARRDERRNIANQKKADAERDKRRHSFAAQMRRVYTWGNQQ